MHKFLRNLHLRRPDPIDVHVDQLEVNCNGLKYRTGHQSEVKAAMDSSLKPLAQAFDTVSLIVDPGQEN